MAILKCKMCGGDLDVAEEIKIVECDYCGTKQTVPNADNEKKINLFNRANRLRMASEFDKAASIYENIIAEFPEEAEAYWGLCLCNYGIEYVDDPATAKKIPTCHRASFESLMKDENFNLALEYADVVAQKVYRDEAREIDRIMQEILAVSKTEKPYDVFICYKETDEKGERTVDSVLAYDIYDALTAKGFNVFFSRVTLEDKLGRQYEPYIFAALNSAKVMLSVGTKYEYFHAVWVKNEWSRFLKLAAKDKSKVLIPCFKDIDAYDMPEEFKALQAQDLGKLGAVQDIVRGVEKLTGKSEPAREKEVTVNNASVMPLLQRAFMFLEDKEWENGDRYFEKVLDMDPQNALAYVGKLMVQLKVKRQQELDRCAAPFETSNYYQKAMRFGDDGLKKELQGYIDSIKTRKLNHDYDIAMSLMQAAKSDVEFKQAAQAFKKCAQFKDSERLAQYCLNKATEIKEEKKKNDSYTKATAILKHAICQGEVSHGIQILNTLGDYKDSQQLIKQYNEKFSSLEATVCDAWKNYCAVNEEIVRLSPEAARLNAPIDKLTAENEKFKAVIADIRNRKKKLNTLNNRKTETQNKLTSIRQSMSSLGLLAFAKKKELSKQADELSAEITEISKQIFQIEEFLSVNNEQIISITIEENHKQIDEYTKTASMVNKQMNQLMQKCNSAIRNFNNGMFILVLAENKDILSAMLEIPAIVKTIKNDARVKERIKAMPSFVALSDAQKQKISKGDALDLETKYFQACDAMNNATSMEDIIWAENEFASIIYYKDAAEKRAKCNAMINDNIFNKT